MSYVPSSYYNESDLCGAGRSKNLMAGFMINTLLIAGYRKIYAPYDNITDNGPDSASFDAYKY